MGDLEKHREAARVVKPRFDLETYPSARVRQGAHELTLRADEKGKAHSTKEINCAKWSPSRVDEEWHALCQALYRCVEVDEWYKMYETRKELNGGLNIKGIGKQMRAGPCISWLKIRRRAKSGTIPRTKFGTLHLQDPASSGGSNEKGRRRLLVNRLRRFLKLQIVKEVSPSSPSKPRMVGGGSGRVDVFVGRFDGKKPSQTGHLGEVRTTNRRTRRSPDVLWVRFLG